ncbi:MAG: hypothetical protein KDK70_30600 [Myxococcales bacterium]|nr:hypothetical protein [Myxococcales bacterium]
MLSLREPQVQALAEPRRSDLEGRLARHARDCFPAAQALGPAALREVVRYGVDRALDHGIDTERGVCRYLNLMFVFGRDFDQDPRLPWAEQILSGARLRRGVSTIELLCREALRHEAAAQGLAGGRS